MVVYQVIMYKEYNLNSIHQLHKHDLNKKNTKYSIDILTKKDFTFLIDYFRCNYKRKNLINEKKSE